MREEEEPRNPDEEAGAGLAEQQKQIREQQRQLEGEQRQFEEQKSAVGYKYKPGERIMEAEEEGRIGDKVVFPTLAGKVFTIVSVDYAPSVYETNREFAILECKDDKEQQFLTTTSAKPVMRQLKKLESYLPVRTTVERIALSNGNTYQLKNIYKV